MMVESSDRIEISNYINNPNYREDPAGYCEVYQLEPVWAHSSDGDLTPTFLRQYPLQATDKIIESVINDFGGGHYQIRVISVAGAYISSMFFRVASNREKPKVDKVNQLSPEDKAQFFKELKTELDLLIEGAVENYRNRLRNAISEGMENDEICPKCCTILHGYLSDSVMFGGVPKK